MQEKLFRKVSLERLSSPEQLDQLMQVTSPGGWMALTALGILVIAAILWGIFGSIPTRVSGEGILIKTGGVLDISAQSSGKVTDISVSVGDGVEKGQIIARISQPELVEQIENTRVSLNEIEDEQIRVSRFEREDIKLQRDSLAGQREGLNESIEVSENHLKWLKSKIASQKKLLQDGLITEEALLLTEKDYYSAKEKVKEARNQLKQVSVKELELEEQKDKELSAIQKQINENKRNIKALEGKLELTSKIRSHYTGCVLEIMVYEGAIVNEGTPVVSVELVGEDIEDEVVIYIQPAGGKKVEPGMEVQVSPSTVKKEEFGVMLGKVTSAAEFPSTYQGMMRLLNNSDLVKQFSEKGAPIQVFVDLFPDNKTFSGYKWSSSGGPPVKVGRGTICTAAITIREQRPISLVIPLVKKYLGI